MGGLQSKTSRKSGRRSSPGKKKQIQKTSKRKDSTSSSSSSSDSYSPSEVRHGKIHDKKTTQYSRLPKSEHSSVPKKGNVRDKMAMYNKLDEESSSRNTKVSSPSSKSHLKQEKRYKDGNKKGFEYAVNNRNNEKVVTIELDIPQLTANDQHSTPYRPVSAPSKSSKTSKMPTKKEFEEACIKAHNDYRRCHDAKPIERDSKLTSMAQEWANKLAKKGNLEHSSNKGFGENVAFTSKSEPSGLEICKMWYDEIKDYNFRSPGFAGNTGHFTQVVWKGTTHVGIGIATGSKGTFVVANYKPAGNITNPGYFKQNVEKQRTKPLFAERRRSSSSSSSSSDEDSGRKHAKGGHKSSSAPKPGQTVDTKTEIYTENGVRKKKTTITTTTVTVTSAGTRTATKTETKIETLPDDGKASGGKSVGDKLKKLRVRKDSSSSSSSSSSSDDDDGGKNVMSSSDTRKFRKDCLERHNELRRRHGAPKLKENKKLQEAAQRHANRMLRREKLCHTDKKKYGENVAMKMPRPSGSEACDMWYDEKKDYDFKKAVFSGNTGHFTQVVWEGTKEVGVGVASDDKGKTYVACFYDPPGNFQGEFANNVKRG